MINFNTPNGVVSGKLLYTSPISRSSKSFVDKVYDDIIYAQNRIIKLHHTLSLTGDDYEEINDPEMEILAEHAIISEFTNTIK